jgi:hypothetical protein
MVERLLQLKAATDEVLTSAFGGNADFGAAAASAFSSCVNSRANKPAELVAK